jgi:hypothetical protein
MRLACDLPNGLFDNGAITSYLARLFSQPGGRTITASWRTSCSSSPPRQRQGSAILGRRRALQARRRVQKLDAERAREEAEG